MEFHGRQVSGASDKDIKFREFFTLPPIFTG